MKIKFCGAAGSVTGSCHLLTTDKGTKILLDCGLYQGHEDFMDNFNNEWLFDPAEIDLFILSHAHIDHIGRVPKLVKDGYKGEIFCTHATRDLSAIMLLDSAFIQEKEALELIKTLLEFPEILKQAAERLEPYRVTDYAIELAASFHKFYTLHRVVSDDEALTQARLLVIDCVRIVLRNTLSVLGMSAPETM